jgi:hypothetical protein
MLVLGTNELRDPPVHAELDETVTNKVESALGAIQAHHPFVRWREWLLAAEEARLSSRSEDAIIRLAVAVEVLLDAAYALSLWEMETPVNEAAELIGVDLGARVRRDFGRVFGGSWARVSGPVARWSSDLTYLRGRVLHRGYRPGQQEVDRAFAAAANIYEHLADRVVLRRARIPKTALLLLGQEGLAHRGALDGVVSRLAAIDLNDDDWLLDYDRWRAQVDETLRGK